ncbi:unnamed protein product [Protopolystoma xenopodis]|uniref:Uncharacterized protein n=1 Tax=Protopolystoma xenopodis TaxID=117903 RepID=A0A448XS62_9PLAT|nr:unnamed protein product [Protopolystoma xenopodis]
MSAGGNGSLSNTVGALMILRRASVEACLQYGLKRRALGLFRESSTLALVHRISKTCSAASQTVGRLGFYEAALEGHPTVQGANGHVFGCSAAPSLGMTASSMSSPPASVPTSPPCPISGPVASISEIGVGLTSFFTSSQTSLLPSGGTGKSGTFGALFPEASRWAAFLAYPFFICE